MWHCLGTQDDVLDVVGKAIFQKTHKQVVFYKYSDTCNRLGYDYSETDQEEGEAFVQIVFSPLMLEMPVLKILQQSYEEPDGLMIYRPTFDFREELPIDDLNVAELLKLKKEKKILEFEAFNADLTNGMAPSQFETPKFKRRLFTNKKLF